MSEFITISVSKITRVFFKKYGSKDETYDDILKRMIPELKKFHEKYAEEDLNPDGLGATVSKSTKVQAT